MSTQPNALALAEAICDYSRRGFETEEMAKLRRMNSHNQAAAELRRLHGEAETYERGWTKNVVELVAAREELRRLRALNAQMLEALVTISLLPGWEEDEPYAIQARSAIEAAQEQS